MKPEAHLRDSLMNRKIELLAGFWTIAGDCYAMGPSEVATFPLRNRVEAAAAAGYTGMGLVHQDFVFNAKAIGYPAMKRMFDDHGIVAHRGGVSRRLV